MKLKTFIYINTIITFIFCFGTHFLYDMFSNSFTALFFPVNESIWEHMKMLYSTILLYGILEYIFLYIKKVPHNNFLFSLFIKATLSIPIYLLVYLPFYFIFGEKMLISIFLLFLILCIINYIGYKILQKKRIKYGNRIGGMGIIVVIILMGYLTYNPPKNFLFLDKKNEKYGIREYVL